MGKCEICGETTHTKEAAHLTKAQLYKLLAKSMDLVDRSYFSGEELDDFGASYLGRTFVLVKDQAGKKLAWFSRAPTTMVYEAQPRPAKILMPNGIIMWMTNRIDNLPDDAREYKVRVSSIPFSAGVDCPSCGSKITLDSLGKKNLRCPNCKKRYKTIVTDAKVIRLWGQEGFVDADIEMKLEAI